MHISFCLCVSKAVELHLLDQKVCVFINLIDVARFPVYIHTFTISECWVLVSLHPVQVQYAVVLRVRLTVCSSVYFSVNCLFLFYIHFSIKLSFSFLFIEALYMSRKLTFCDLVSDIFPGLPSYFVYWDFFSHVDKFISSWNTQFFGGISIEV